MIGRNVPAYRQIIVGRLRMAVTYRQNALLLLATVLVQIFVLRQIWTALYAGHDVVAGLDLQAVLAYITIANLQNWALQDPEISSYMHGRIREGQVAFDLLRPAGFVPQMVAHLAGASLVMAAFVVVVLPFLAVFGGLQPPASPTAFVLWLPSLLCGYAVAVLLNLTVGLTGFWTIEINGVMLFYYLINQFLAGALVPLPLFPDALRALTELLPFQATTYTPTAIYLGRLTGSDALAAFAVQAIWVLLLAAGARQLWRLAMRRVVVQGG